MLNRVPNQNLFWTKSQTQIWTETHFSTSDEKSAWTTSAFGITDWQKGIKYLTIEHFQRFHITMEFGVLNFLQGANSDEWTTFRAIYVCSFGASFQLCMSRIKGKFISEVETVKIFWFVTVSFHLGEILSGGGFRPRGYLCWILAVIFLRLSFLLCFHSAELLSACLFGRH